MHEFAFGGCPGPTIYHSGLAAPGFEVGVGFNPLSPGDWAKAAETIVTTTTKVFGAPALLVEAIASGTRVDKALVKSFKDQVANLKELAPYVSTVVSFVPGVGSGVSAALNAGMALAEGKSITEAVTAGIKGALPGGALAGAAFDTAMKVAGGANVGKAALESARNALPGGEAAKKAFDTGLAVLTAAQAQMAKSAPKGSPAASAYDILKDEFAKARPQLEAAFKAADEAIAGAQRAAQEGQALIDQKRAQVTAEWAAKAKAWEDKAAADLVALSKLTPSQLKEVKDWRALAKLTPDQQKQLVAYAASVKAANEAKAKTAAAVATAAADAAKAAAAAKAVAVTKARADALSKAVATASQSVPGATPAPTAPVATAPSASTAPAAPTSRTYAPYPSATTGVSAPPMHGHGHGGGSHGGGHHGGGGGHHGGRDGRPGFTRVIQDGRRDWGWGVPWSPEVVTKVETCRVWSNPIAMPPAMDQAARMALGASGGRPTAVRGPDNLLYLFSFDNGVMTARSCSSVSAA